MRVLILGATGFVGRHLLRECRGRGDDLQGTFRPGETIPSEFDTEWHPVDLLKPSTIEEALRSARPEGVVHLAGQANVAQAARDPVPTFRVNAEGTLQVLNSVRKITPESRVVVVTSAEVYGSVPAEELPVREDRPLAPRTPYGASKAAADLVAQQAAAGWGLDVVVMRPFNHVGPGQRLGFVVPDFASQIAEIERGVREPVLTVGNLSPRRDFTDVRDIIRGYRTALEAGRPGGVYNLCSGVSVPIQRIVDHLVGLAEPSISIEADRSRQRSADVPEFRGDPSRAARELGWKPEIPLETSLTEVLEEWRRAVERHLHPEH